MADKGLELQVAKFNSFTRDLARQTRADLPTVIRSEVGSILERAAKATRKATRASVARSQQSPPRSPWRTYGGQKLRVDWRHPDEKWARIQSELKKSIQEKARRAGMASAAFLEMARQLNINADFPAKTRKAPQSQNFRRTTETRVNDDPKRYFIEIINRSNLLRHADARQALFKAVAGRSAFFQRNLQAGVFKSASAIAKKYPGITVSK